MGVFENKNFSDGTKELCKLIARSDAYTLAGGGETLSAINQFINKEDITEVIQEYMANLTSKFN